MTRPGGLTPVQLSCLRVVQDFTDGHGIAPTMAQVASTIGTSKGNVHRVVDILIRKGWIEREAYRARGLRLIHRLPPTENAAALAELAKVLEAAAPSPDGFVRFAMPKPMVDAAIAAIAAKAA